MINNTNIKNVVVYYHVPPESKINNIQVVSEVNNIKNYCRQFGWKPVNTFIDRSADGAIYNTMMAFVADQNNNITAIVCYTAGDSFIDYVNKDKKPMPETHTDTTENKKFVGGVPYGYTVGSGGVLILDKDKAAAILEIFEYKAKGNSLQRIADTLNEKGIKSGRGNDWNKQGISFILKNRTYIGEIVSEQLFNKVNGIE